MEIETNLLNPPDEFLVETFNEVGNRYLGFGKYIYDKIQEQLPEIFENLIFYKRQTFQIEDSYAEYKGNKNSFAIQLDPLCEVIVLWNDRKCIEIGTWSKNEYDEAINFIKSDLINKDSKLNE